MNNIKMLVGYSIVSFMLISHNVLARPIPSDEKQKAFFQKIVDTIKITCKTENPTNDILFKECGTIRYDAMKWFFKTLFEFRDAKGMNSEGFKKGMKCTLKFSPYVNEPGRKQAFELTDWLKVKICYKNSLKR